MKFHDIGIDKRIEQILDQLGYAQMLPIQERLIPILRQGKNCCAHSRTGSGKTIAYGLPLIEKIKENQKKPQALILVPTRELAIQVAKEITLLGTYLRIKCAVLIGKQSMEMQAEDLKERTHIIVGTPGRVYDHLVQGSLCLDQIHSFVLDEADALLNPDFYEKIEKIVQRLPKAHQTCLVSATENEAVANFLKTNVSDVTHIEVDEVNTQMEQYYLHVEEEKKMHVLEQVLLEVCPQACIIFCAQKQRVDEVAGYLKKQGISVEGIHAGLEQADRLQVLDAFREGKLRCLVATDVLARGIDIDKVDLVINYDRPSTSNISTHRMGRSGRVYQNGSVLTFYPPQFTVSKAETLWSHREIEDMEKARKILSSSSRKTVDKESLARQEITCLYLNAGKSKKVRAGDIVGALLSIEGIEMEDIGVIRVQDHQSYVDIYHNKANLVLRSLKTVKKKRVKVEPAHS